MARLRHPTTEPPDGFFFIEPVTGLKMEARTLTKLVDLVIEHRKWKGIEPCDHWSVQKACEDQICSAMPEGTCRPDPGEDYRPINDQARGMTLESLMSASAAALRFIQSGGALVDKNEAIRRAEICRRCRFNRPSPCVICTPVFKLVETMIPKDRIQPGLSACGVCGCSLQIKTLLPLAVIRAEDEKFKYRFPGFCWLNPANG